MSYLKRSYNAGLQGIESLAFNNTYDAEFVRDHAMQVRDQLYTRCLDTQERMCGINIVAGKMSEFRRNPLLARVFELPTTTYFARVQNKYLHVFAEKESLYCLAFHEDPIRYPEEGDPDNNYPFSPYYTEVIPHRGQHYRKFSLYDVCKEHTIFQKRLLFYVREKTDDNPDAFLYMDLQIIPTKDATYLAILTTGDRYFNRDYLEHLRHINTDWYLYESNAGNYYVNLHYPTSYLIDEGRNIYLQHFFPDNDGENKAKGPNAYLVATEANYPNLWKVCYSTYVKSKDGYKTVSGFIDNTANEVPILILNERQLGYSVNVESRMQSLSSTCPLGIFQLPLKRNPIPLRNILSFLEDPVTGRLAPLPQTFMEMWYPNVYRISYESLETEGANIRVLAYYEPSATTEFINPIPHYMKYRENQYISDCLNGTQISPVAMYAPIKDTFSMQDYRNSRYWSENNPYQYIMDNLIWMLLDDPNRYIPLFKDVTRELTNHNIYYREFSVQKMKLLERRVRNNHAQIQSKAKHIEFDEDMTYLAINVHSIRQLPMWIFTDGYMIPLRHVFNEGFVQYIYFPIRYVKPDGNVIIEIFDVPNDHVDVNTQRGSLLFKSLSDSIPFPETFDHFADQNLIYYDTDTKEIIPNQDFRYGIYIDVEKEHILTSDIEKLKTAQDEYVITGSHLKLVSAKGNSDKSSPDFMGNGSTGNDGFYKNVGTRVSIQQIDLKENPDIFNNTYRSNTSLLGNPALHREWDEDMLCIIVEADNASFYPIYLEIDGVRVTQSDIYRYFEFQMNTRRTMQFLFFPKRYALRYSKIAMSTLISTKWEYLSKQVSFDSTAQICVSLNNKKWLNRNITVQATDTYRCDIWPQFTNSLVIQNFTGDHKVDRFRFWRLISEGPESRAILLNPKNYEFRFSNLYGGDLIIENTIGTPEYAMIIEYLPFRTNECATYSDVGPSPTRSIDFTNELERPIDLEYYEIYANGKRLDGTMCKGYPETHLVLKNIETTAEIAVLEKSHDTDVYGNRFRHLTLEEQIMHVDPAFKAYMIRQAFAE